MMAVEYRYTDRNVREDPSLTDYAIAYVKTYGGDFEPLVNAKRMLIANGTLDTPTTRVVLNCMRLDANVAGALPMPTAPVLELVSTKRQKKRMWTTQQCGNQESHSPHFHSADMTDCPGIPYKINRHAYTDVEATIKMPYVMAPTGKLIHRTNGNGWVRWHAYDMHAYGYSRAYIIAKTRCKYPSWIHRAVLMNDLPDLSSPITNPFVEHIIAVCDRCENDE